MWYQEQVKARVELHDAFNDLPLSARFLLPFVYFISIITSIFNAARESFKIIFALIKRKTAEPRFDGINSISSKSMGGTTEDINQEDYNEDYNEDYGEDYNEDYNEDYTNQEDMIGGMIFTRTRKAAKAAYNLSLIHI